MITHFLLTMFLLSSIVLMQSCSSVTGTKKVAAEWCSCMKDSDAEQSAKSCDSIAEMNLELMVKEKWKEVQEKQLPIDTMRAYKLSIHMEYYKMTEKCRK
ncbi:MAG: hypothetical protein ACK5F4_07270 [Ignavibacteria bacterium]|jgi:ABC-type protease/lipase transport system fused ATPase/permease subunit